ncbi:MAG TPA: HAMP domain-containing sensor histidine kinase [Candidatus Binatia bacterium]|nr:HAMP domain-containing sensor histidine kinase [Candidatus Binatia bacterium]
MPSRPTMATRVVTVDVPGRPPGPARPLGVHGLRAVPVRPGQDVRVERPASPRPRIEKTVLAGAIYHELRSTLGLISGYSESLLHLDLDEPTRRRYLERLASAAASLSEIADQLLDLAAADPRRPIVRRQPVSLAWLAERLAADATAEMPGAVVRLDLAAELPLVEADPIWLGLVLRNLLRNALTHGRGQIPEVVLRAERVGEQVVVSVSDNGPGFEPGERELAFGLFFRGRRARTAGREGLGLGLYLCRALVEAHGGAIWIEDSGSGATVAFSLPVGDPRRAVGLGRVAADPSAGDHPERERHGAA